MGTRAWWLAWSVCALSLALAGLAIGFLVLLNLSHPGIPIYYYWVHATVITVAFSTVGAIIASRRPEHQVGWLFCAIGFLVGVDHFCGEYATYALLARPGTLPAGEAAAWVRSWIWIISGGLGVFLVLLFPNGRLASVRWRYLAWLNVFVIVGGSIAVAFSPGPIDGLGPIRNPLGIDSLGTAFGERLVDSVEVFQITVALVAVVSPFVWLRYAGFKERQQVKWFAYAAVLLIIGALITSLVPDLQDARWVSWVGFVIYIAGLVGLPVAVGIAVLHQHLYGIDILINRTLVYGSLTTLLALLYFGGVALVQGTGSVIFQMPFRTFTDQNNQFVTVGATLAIAALFTPLRRWIQGFIDKRFYRGKYDARKTLTAFSAKLRDETDLDTLSEDLVEVIKETMQPANVSLWLRSDVASKGAWLDRPRSAGPTSQNEWRE